MNISFRKMTDSEWNILLSLERQSAGKHYLAITDETELRTFLKKSQVYFICDSLNPIGHIEFELQNDRAELNGLVLTLPYQKKGIGQQAINHVLNDLKSLNVKIVWLTVHPHNNPAIKLYLRCGFVIKAWKDNYYGDGTPRLILEKEI